MPTDVYVAIWHLNTRVDPAADFTVAGKAQALSAAVTNAELAFQQLGAGAGDIRIFAAPEYYFCRSGDRIKGFDVAEKNAVLAQLAQISIANPDMILIPGTVAWKEQWDRAQRQAAAQVVQNTLDNAPAEMGDLYRKDMAAAHSAIALGRNRFNRQRADKMRWYGHNTCFVYCGGAQIEELNKAMPYFEFSGEDPADRIFMVPGHRSGAMTIPQHLGPDGQRLRIGVEICADHGSERLAKNAGGRVDVHVVISATQIAQHPASRAGGLMVHADSERAPAVFKVAAEGGFHNKVRHNWGAANVVDDGADLYCVKAELDDPV